ncbi:MAG: hypothetical protein ABSE54_03550 [Smithella sp.]
MENKEIIKHLIDLQKTSFENCFSAIVTLQDQAEKLFVTFVDHTPGMDNGGKELMDKWSNAYKKGRDNFKKAVVDGYSKAESFLDDDTMALFEDQTKKIFDVFLNQNNGMFQDSKKIIEKIAANYKNGSDEFKKYFNDNIWCLKYFYPVADKSQTDMKKTK